MISATTDDGEPIMWVKNYVSPLVEIQTAITMALAWDHPDQLAEYIRAQRAV